MLLVSDDTDQKNKYIQDNNFNFHVYSQLPQDGNRREAEEDRPNKTKSRFPKLFPEMGSG